MKITKRNYLFLPREIQESIDSIILTKIQKSHCFKFCDLLIRDSIRESGHAFDYSPKSYNYMLATFGGTYQKWLKPLISNNIILRSNYYSNGSVTKTDNVCYSYSLNYDLLKVCKCDNILDSNNYEYCSNNLQYLNITDNNTSSTLCHNYLGKALILEGYRDVVKYGNGAQDNKFVDLFINDFSTLNIDYVNLYNIADNYIESISIDDFKINEKISETTVEYIFEGNKYRVSRDYAISFAKQKGMDLIKDKLKYYVIRRKDFLIRKKISLSMAYKGSILKLEQLSYRAKRNLTNNRLDTNITNMPSILLDEACRTNSLVQIDLANSQFAILSKILEKQLFSDDFKLFKELSVNGELYSFVAGNCDPEARKNAKIALFAIMFARENSKNNLIVKKRLKTLFPSVMDWIKSYKKINGYENFSIMLQQKESEIFIDGVYALIKENKMFCLTKHDSIIVKAKDLNKALELTISYFSKMDFTGKLVLKM